MNDARSMFMLTSTRHSITELLYLSSILEAYQFLEPQPSASDANFVSGHGLS